MNMIKQPLRVGVGGPVGSGKTALLEALCKAMRDTWQLAVVTNDIYTKEDQRILTEAGALEPERIVGVETGGCPHTAIREDASMNLAAVEALSEKFGNLDLIFVESGGDNLSATFSPELADLTIYVIDVAEGEKIPRKGGPGITKSDFLVINKTDLAPYVGASLEVMERDTLRMRGERPWSFTNLKSGDGLQNIIALVKHQQRLFQRFSRHDGHFGVVQQLDQGVYVVATDHGAQQLGGLGFGDQANLNVTMGHSGQEAGLDLGCIVHAGRHAVGEQVQQKGFFTGGRVLDQLDHIGHLFGIQGQGGDAQLGAFGHVFTVGLQHACSLQR